MEVSQKKSEYIINMWSGGSTNGTHTIYRTTDKELWLSKIKAMIIDDTVRERLCRVVVRGNVTIFSFARSEAAYYAWRFAEIVKTPDYMKYGYPKEIAEL